MNNLGINERIVSNPETLAGKPRVRGTRLSVEFLVRLLGAGWNERQILKSYPHLTPEDLTALVAYASANPVAASSDDETN